MNSDFVISENSFVKLYELIEEGNPCILAPSLRAIEETASKELIKLVDATKGTLSIKSRDLVNIALNNLHPTVIAKTVNQSFVSCETYNQIYWNVDESTLLCRHYLIFMLAITPEKNINLIDSYCDYGFIPSLVPSGKFKILDNSEDFFMLELQAKSQEIELLNSGNMSQNVIAKKLEFWTTQEHREFANHEIVFHSKDIPENISVEKEKFKRYYDSLCNEFEKGPVPYQFHYFWINGVRAWNKLRNDKYKKVVKPPKELAEITYYSKWEALNAKLMQKKSNALIKWFWLSENLSKSLILHINYQNSKLFKKICLENNSNDFFLLVCNSSSSLPVSLSKKYKFEIYWGLKNFCNDKLSNTKRFKKIIVHVFRSNITDINNIVDSLDKYLMNNGSAFIFFDYEGGQNENNNFTSELPKYCSDIISSKVSKFDSEIFYTGGKFSRKLVRFENFCKQKMYNLNWYSLKFYIYTVMILSNRLLICINNLLFSKIHNVAIQFSSAIVFSVHKKN